MGTGTTSEKYVFVDSKLFHFFQVQLCELYFSEQDTAVRDITRPHFFNTLAGEPIFWRG